MSFSGDPESAEFRIRPVSADQSGTYSDLYASKAIDGDFQTGSHTGHCGSWNVNIWFRINFESVHCFKKVEVHSMFPAGDLNAWRMHDTKVVVINTESSSENLCGIIDANIYENTADAPIRR